MSKGGEAALLIAATWPDEVAAVVTVVGSGVVYGGIDDGSVPGNECSSWSLGGQPLPHIDAYRGLDWRALYSSGDPVLLTPVHRAGLLRVSAEEREAATIRTERFGGPLLLISGGDDQLWPSAELSDLAYQRRAAAGLETEHLTHPQAGHRLGLPGLPGVRAPSLGGQPWADAQVQMQGWERTLAVLGSAWGQEKV